MTSIITESALLRLMQLASPSLPVGGYAYSLGMEPAVEAGVVTCGESCQSWIAEQIRSTLAWLDLPVIMRLYQAFRDQDVAGACHWNDVLLASRETRELRLTDTAMGCALASLLDAFGIHLQVRNEPAFAATFAGAAVHWHIPEHACVAAYAWVWLENQVMTATRLLPLGQTEAQQMLGRLQVRLMEVISHAGDVEDCDVGITLPALAILSARHEIQYSRLFRS